MSTAQRSPLTYAVSEQESATVNLTAYEKRITEWAIKHTDELAAAGVSWGSSKIKRLAYRMCKEQARTWDQDLWNVFGVPDPTPIQAFRNIEREGARP